MTALFLGRPFHGATRQIEVAREKIELVVSDERARKHCPGGQSAAVTPRRIIKVTYVRDHSPGLPEGALVYRRRDYEPQDEDADLVRWAFG